MEIKGGVKSVKVKKKLVYMFILSLLSDVSITVYNNNYVKK